MRLAFRPSVRFLFVLLFCAAVSGAVPSKEALSDQNRLDILRKLAFEYATTLQPLPAIRGEKEAVEVSEGRLNEEKLRQTLVNRGVAVPEGEVVQITGVQFQRRTILIEINGGVQRKKKWYQRLTVHGGMGGTQGMPPPPSYPAPPPPGGSSSNVVQGCYVVLSFAEQVPDLSGEEVRKMLGSVLDFSRQSAAIPWIETIPEEFREAIRNRKAKVGMSRDMVLAALGRPDRKVREVKNDQETEDWIYGYPPFVTFVTFIGEKVSNVKEFR
ncbi:MAG: hypothetical protein ACRD35_04205 [Candidatus Acidiferrales bacterium]